MRSGTIINETVHEEDVFLDGARIVDSTFRGCKLIFQGERPVHMERSTFIACSWAFEGPAELTVDFLKAMYDAGGDGRKNVEQLIRYVEGKGPPRQKI